MTIITLTKTDLQRECFTDFISDYPRVIQTLEGGEWPCADICYQAMVLDDMLVEHEGPAEPTDLQKAILQAAVEKSLWLAEFEGQCEWSKGRVPTKMKTLRECAALLERYGIEVSFLPKG